MSDDHGAGAPSFGDLFDDPEAPEAAAPAVPAAPASGPTVAVASTAAADDADAEDSLDDATDDDHDLDHSSDEAAHQVAGFEHDEPADDSAHGDADGDADDAHDADDHDGAAAPAVAAAAAGAVSVAAAPWDGTPDPSISSAPAGRVDTGRLYRSAGAEGPATLDAIPALDPERLAAIEAARPAPQPAAPSASRGGSVGLTYSGVMVVVIAATVIVAFLDAVLRKEIGWLTGIALLVSSVYAAAFVRRADIWAAVVAPPLAFLAATLTAGQLTLGSTGSFLEREAFMVFKSLAVNAPWILASTLVSLVIVLVRRRRSPA